MAVVPSCDLPVVPSCDAMTSRAYISLGNTIDNNNGVVNVSTQLMVSSMSCLINQNIKLMKHVAMKIKAIVCIGLWPV